MRKRCQLINVDVDVKSTSKDIACSRAHMFVTCLSYRTSLLAVTIVNNYTVTWLITCPRDMPLQKLRGVAIFVSLQECGFSGL